MHGLICLLLKNWKVKAIDRKEVKKDIDDFFRAAMSAVCNCYKHSDGFYPDECSCDQREQISKSMSLLISERDRIIRAHNL